MATSSAGRRRRILVVASWYPSGAAATGIFVADQVDALLTKHDVTVIAPEQRGLRLLLARRSHPTTTSEDHVIRPVARQWVPRSARAAKRAYGSAVEAAYRSVERRVGRPDVIHAHVTYPGGFAAVKVGRRHGIPVVVTEHAGPFAAILTSPQVEDAARWTLQHAARVIAVAPSLRDEMHRLVPDCAIDVVGNVVDTDFFTPGPEPRPDGAAPPRHTVRLFTSGVQAPQKGVDILLAAVQTLVAAGVDVELVVGGDGPSRAELQREALRLGVAAQCRFAGSLSRSQVREELRACDLYVSASRHESFGLAIAEALACERPVVATRAGGPESFVEPAYGVLVAPGDPAALATAIRNVATAGSRLDGHLGRRRIVERFGQEAFLAAMDRVYGAVIASAEDGRAFADGGRNSRP